MTTIEDLKAAADEVGAALTDFVETVSEAVRNGVQEPKDAPKVKAALVDVLRAIGEIPMVAPEGVEFAMRVYIRCDAADLSHVLNFPGNHMMPPRDPSGYVDVSELIEQVADEGQRAMLRAAGRWRVMTRPEISRYKARMARVAREFSTRGQMTPFREQ